VLTRCSLDVAGNFFLLHPRVWLVAHASFSYSLAWIVDRPNAAASFRQHSPDAAALFRHPIAGSKHPGWSHHVAHPSRLCFISNRWWISIELCYSHKQELQPPEYAIQILLWLASSTKPFSRLPNRCPICSSLARHRAANPKNREPCYNSLLPPRPLLIGSGR
jgi:hypothetical protein